MSRDLRAAGNAPADKRITFRRTRPRLWKGNGFGYEPAHYAVLRDGREIGTIIPRAVYGWLGDICGSRFTNDKLADLKKAIIVSCRTMP